MRGGFGVWMFGARNLGTNICLCMIAVWKQEECMKQIHIYTAEELCVIVATSSNKLHELYYSSIFVTILIIFRYGRLSLRGVGPLARLAGVTHNNQIGEGASWKYSRNTLLRLR